MKIISIEPLPGYTLKVTFDDGVSGMVDLKSFIENGVFAVLKDEALFNKVYNTGYSIAWSDELEIDSLAVYAELLHKDPEEILASDFKYATN